MKRAAAGLGDDQPSASLVGDERVSGCFANAGQKFGGSGLPGHLREPQRVAREPAFQFAVGRGGEEEVTGLRKTRAHPFGRHD